VVHGRSCLVLAAARGLYHVHCTGAICLLIDATVVVGGGLLVVLLAPLLSGFGVLLSTVGGDAAPSI
jgi:hypothetical protein